MKFQGLPLHLKETIFITHSFIFTFLSRKQIQSHLSFNIVYPFTQSSLGVLANFDLSVFPIKGPYLVVPLDITEK